jgi:hypothetical protein
MVAIAIMEFFASISNPSQILSSGQVSTIDVITGGYNIVSICTLKLADSTLFPFVLRVPSDDPESHACLPRWQTSTSVGCMLYCQRHFHELGIPTPGIYAFSDSPGLEFIAMEYVDGEALGDAWMDLSFTEKECLIGEIAEIMKRMRSRKFSVIGGITPEGLPSPVVDGVDAANGRVCEQLFCP